MTTTNTGEGMVERVARAIWDCEDPTSGDPLGVLLHGHNPFVEGESRDEMIAHAFTVATAAARAAIEAMREPTEAMEMAGFLANRFENPRPCGSTCIGRITIPAGKPWSAMIDAALHNEGQST